MSGGKILVIRGGAIGDFVLTLPVFSALREQFPRSSLSVLGYPHIANLALAGGLVDEMRSIEAGPLAGFFARGGTLSPGLREYFSQFAVILSYLYDPDGIFEANVRSCSKAQFIAGPHRPDESKGAHATEALLAPLERLAIFGAGAVPTLRFVSADVSEPADEGAGNGKAETDLRRGTTVAIHPGSGSERKNWPEERWARLLRKLAGETTWRFLLIGGEAEGERIGRLAPLLPSGRVEVARNLPLPVLGRRLQRCAGYVGHDSGISHIAAAVGLPGVLLWGDSNERIWFPRGGRMTPLREPSGLSALAEDRVFQAVFELMQPA